MTWCTSCGEQYEGRSHNCGYARVPNDELQRSREIEAAAVELLTWGQHWHDEVGRITGSVDGFLVLERMQEALGEQR
jgi:hypothetical protein